MSSAPHRFAGISLEYGEICAGPLLPALCCFRPDLGFGLLQRLFRRRWVFDPDPLKLPTGFDGGLFRSPGGSLLASLVNTMPRLTGRALADNTACVKTRDVENAKRVTLQHPGGPITTVPFHKENGAIQFDVPGHTVAAVAEVEF